MTVLYLTLLFTSLLVLKNILGVLFHRDKRVALATVQKERIKKYTS